MTVQAVLERVARKLTELDDRSVRLGGSALSLQDPRDLAHELHRRAKTMPALVESGMPAEGMAEAVGALAVAYLLARARVDELDVSAGSDTEEAA